MLLFALLVDVVNGEDRLLDIRHNLEQGFPLKRVPEVVRADILIEYSQSFLIFFDGSQRISNFKFMISNL